MGKANIVSLEDRIPKLKEQRKRKTNRRLIFLISVFFLLIILVIYFQSPLSHVGKITVAGNNGISKGKIIEKSTLTTKTNIWNMNKTEIENKINRLPEVKSVVVKRTFPNKIMIQVTEHKQIATLVKGKSFIPVLENGTTLKNSASNEFKGPLLVNFQQGKFLKEMVSQLQQLPFEIENSISEIHYNPEKTDDYHLLLFMNDGYEVSASIKTFADKMVHYPSIISQLSSNQKGIIDIEVGTYFKPFKSEGDQKK